VFFVARPNENVRYFNFIAAKHVDFLLCRADNMKPLLGIELDDASHAQARREERDQFVEQVFADAGLPLARLPVQREYNANAIGQMLEEYLETREEQDALQPAAPAPAAVETKAAPPVCPKCGVPMVLRTVRDGPHKGKQFYGCVNFPRCREVRASK
jgi:hypothetical protein